MRSWIESFLKSSPAMLSAAVVLGFLIPAPDAASVLILPALFLAMTFSMGEVDLSIPKDTGSALFGLILNYGVLSGIILMMASSLDNEPFFQGFVVMAAVPPAVAVVPLSRLLLGDVRLSLYAEAACYILSMFLMPAIILIFTGVEGAGVVEVMEAVLALIAVPAVLSRKACRIGLDPVLPVNAGLFAVTYIIVGTNRGALASDAVLGVAMIAVVRTFLIGSLLYAVLGLLKIEYRKRISMTLLGSFKNLGLSAAVAVLLFGNSAGVPSAVCAIAETLFYIALSTIVNRSRSVSGSLK